MNSSISNNALDIVIFGGAGDLSFRKLLPALYMAHLHDKLSTKARIVAVGRQNWSLTEYIKFIDQHSPSFIEKSEFDPEVWQSFLARLSYVSLDVTQAADYSKLKDVCIEPALRVFYLATAPSLFTQICAHLSAAGLVDAQARVVLEKPLGTDLASAQHINNEVAKYFAEQQVYRIDHYLGKETVQNLMVLRTLHQECANHCGRKRGRGQSRWFLRWRRRDARHGAKPFAAIAVHRGHGATDFARRRRCAR
jgi:glucose-6-phosphate 1-dehydrogenase